MRLENDQVKAVAVLLILGAAFLGGLWLPHNMKLKRLQARIDAAHKELGFQKVSPNELTALAQNVQVKRDTLAASTRYVPATSEIAELLRELSDRLEARKVVDQSLLTRSVEVGDEFSVIPVSLRFQGTFASAFGFLRDVEQMRRLTRIVRLELTGRPTRPNDPLDVRVELCTFATGQGGSN